MPASSIDSKNEHDPTVVLMLSLTAWPLCFVANPLANIEISLFAAWIAPLILGLPVGMWAGLITFKRFLYKANDTAAFPQLDAVLVGMASLCVAGTATYWSVRNLLQGVGAFVPGVHTLVPAQLVHLQEPSSGGKAHCKQYATFRITGRGEVKICVVSSWRTLSKQPIDYGGPLSLEVVTNFTGSRVASIVRR